MTSFEKNSIAVAILRAFSAMAFVVFSVSVVATYFDDTDHEMCLKFSDNYEQYQECIK